MPGLHASTRIIAPSAVRPTDYELLALASRLTTATGLTNIVNITGDGVCGGVSLRVKVVPDGAPTLVLEFEVDGEAQIDEPIYTSLNTWSDALRVLAQNRDGNTIGHTVLIPCNIVFETSFRCGLRCTVSGGAAGEIEGVVPIGDHI